MIRLISYLNFLGNDRILRELPEINNISANKDMRRGRLYDEKCTRQDTTPNNKVAKMQGTLIVTLRYFVNLYFQTDFSF